MLSIMKHSWSKALIGLVVISLGSAGTVPPGVAQSTAPSSGPDLHSQATEPVALGPGQYCYRIGSHSLTGVVRVTVASGNQVTGDSHIMVHQAEQNYHTSYVQKFSGSLAASQVAVGVTTWIENDVQESQETWTMESNTLKIGENTFESLDCAIARQQFVNEDGLEASDLLGSPLNINSQRIEFLPNTTSALVEGAVVTGERDLYLIQAQGGQQMTLLLSSLEENAAFDLISPSGYVLITEGETEIIPLPQTGEYQLLVGGTRGNATYSLEVTLQ